MSEDVTTSRDEDNDSSSTALKTEVESQKQSQSKEFTLLSLLKAQKVDDALKFLDQFPDCNAVDEHGNGLLHLALQIQNSKEVVELVKRWLVLAQIQTTRTILVKLRCISRLLSQRVFDQSLLPCS